MEHRHIMIPRLIKIWIKILILVDFEKNSGNKLQTKCWKRSAQLFFCFWRLLAFYKISASEADVFMTALANKCMAWRLLQKAQSGRVVGWCKHGFMASWGHQKIKFKQHEKVIIHIFVIFSSTTYHFFQKLVVIRSGQNQRISTKLLWSGFAVLLGCFFPKLLFATCEHISQQGLCLKELPWCVTNGCTT